MTWGDLRIGYRGGGKDGEFRYFGDGLSCEPITFHGYDVDGCQVFPVGDAQEANFGCPFPLMINSSVSILEFYL